ncbi:hypothetical protein Tco_0807948 [Tanacetum coccineum]
MSTSKTYQQSLADAGSENRPPMLERGSYIPWASRFRQYLNRKRDTRKWWKRISKKQTQNEAKRTKPSTGLERA